jgi:glycosyltransferase involved in cell wall biosynthesis
MKIGILGTRGIPNHYGGFEQMAQYLSAGLVRKNHDVFVYSPHDHPYQKKNLNGVNIIHCNDPEYKYGTAGQFIYDLNCINDARNRNFDILLHLGYTSDSIWHRRWPKNSINIMNMDGLEWKRQKYNRVTKLFLKQAEKLAVKNAHILIADSPYIQKYIEDKYQRTAVYIPYGATVFSEPDPLALKDHFLIPHRYYLTIARMEPENNIEMIIKGFLASKQEVPLVIVGNTANKHGRYLTSHYKNPKIIFPGAIYDLSIINNLRFYSTLYLHGHSVGGTNPSLLEAMACSCNILAHENIFNRTVLGEGAGFFSSSKEITAVMNSAAYIHGAEQRKRANIEKIESVYSWPKIINSYEDVMLNSPAELYNVLHQTA